MDAKAIGEGVLEGDGNACGARGVVPPVDGDVVLLHRFVGGGGVGAFGMRFRDDVEVLVADEGGQVLDFLLGVREAISIPGAALDVADPVGGARVVVGCVGVVLRGGRRVVVVGVVGGTVRGQVFVNVEGLGETGRETENGSVRDVIHVVDGRRRRQGMRIGKIPRVMKVRIIEFIISDVKTGMRFSVFVLKEMHMRNVIVDARSVMFGLVGRVKPVNCSIGHNCE